MKTRVGSARRNSNRTLTSENRRLTKGAQERLDNVVSRANDRHQNALAVDGIELTLWKRQKTGNFCTCHGDQFNNSVTPLAENSSNTELGNFNEDEFIQLEEQPEGSTSEPTSNPELSDDSESSSSGSRRVETNIQFNDNNDDDFTITSLRDDRRIRAPFEQFDNYLEDREFADNPKQKYFLPQSGPDDVIIDNKNTPDRDNTEDSSFDNDEDKEIDEDFAEFSQRMQSEPSIFDIDDSVDNPDINYSASEDDTARLTRSIESLLTGGESVPCGICFSTGWTEGYELFNGRRILLTTHNITNTGGFEVDSDARPYKIDGNSESAPIQWKIDLPTYFHSVIRFKVWDNLTDAPHVDLQIKYKDTDFIKLEPRTFQLRNGLDNTGAIIQVSPNEEARNSFIDIRFTHVELVIELTPKIIGQIPQVEIAETFDLYEAIIQTNIEWPARIAKLTFGSVAIDSKHHRAWRIVSVSENKTSDSKVFSIETQAVMLQQKEPLERLNIYRSRFITNRNYKGLEPFQGSNQTGEYDENFK